MSGEHHIVNSQHTLECFIDDCRARFAKHHYTDYQWVNNEKRRTLTQNACIHKWCAMLAERFNAAGYERHITSKVLSKPVELPWTMDSVKEEVWHTVQLAMTQKESSRDLSTKEVSAICEVIHRHLASNFGLEVEWPHND